MKRQDLALSQEESLAIIDAVQYAVLCLTDPDGRPYGLPMDYVRQGDVLYFHGSQEGRKIAAMKSNPQACAVIMGETQIRPARFGREYASVIADGTIELINEPEIKRQVMTWVVERKSPDNIEKGKVIIEKMLDRVLVYKMQMETITGKHGL